jgi:uncharacterized repeat protein (TIGR04138 family)
MADGWKEAYAAMHRDGAAAFPPACLHYVLGMVRHSARQEHGSGGSPSLSPSGTVAAFRRAVRADFGPLAGEVLKDWALLTPGDLGRAVDLLGRYGCLSLDAGDSPEAFATDTVPFVGAAS